MIQEHSDNVQKDEESKDQENDAKNKQICVVGAAADVAIAWLRLAFFA